MITVYTLDSKTQKYTIYLQKYNNWVCPKKSGPFHWLGVDLNLFKVLGLTWDPMGSLPGQAFGRPKLKNCTQPPRPRPSLRCYRCRLHNSQLFQSKQQSGHEPAKKHIFLVFHWLTLIFSDRVVTVSPLLNNVFSIFCPKMFFKIEVICRG